MARATLEMFLKLTGADKTSQGLDKVSKTTKELDNNVKNSAKQNEQFAAGMSGLNKAAIAGAAIFAGKSLLDFSINAIQAASSAQEAAGAFGTTFGGAAEKLNQELAKNANLFGLTQAEAQQLISVFGAVAQGMGFTQDESANLGADLFQLAGDIASFNNITAGAEPVIRAFQSAIVGEREALKTYGIAISEAEVQTKAFEMTGKNSAEALTRQERALATTELLFDKASVQIGNAERESSGFAAQMLIAKSSTQELREELGEQLLPAAGEILRTFNEMREDATPALIQKFSDLNLQIVGTVELFNELRDVLSFGNDEIETTGDLVAQGLFGKFKAFGKVLKAYGAVVLVNNKAEQKRQEELDNTINLYQNYAQVLAAAGVKTNYLRTTTLIATTQTSKFADTIDKKLNPIFGEQNALILSNIQLETNRNTLMKLINSANEDLSAAQTNYNNALKEVNRLTIEENVRDAEAAIRKAELQTQIALLTEAQSKGKDVSLDLALAQAELAQVEYELANDSDALIAARNLLTVAEQNLETATKNQENAIKERNKALYDSQGFLEDAGKDTETYTKKVEESIRKQNELLRKFKEIERAGGGGFKDTSDTGKDTGNGVDTKDTGNGVDIPADTLGNQSNVDTNNGGGVGAQTFNFVLELDGEALQYYQIKSQQQGKTFNIVGQ